MNIYKRRFINYWNGQGQTPVHPKHFNFTQNGINYNNIVRPVTIIRAYPHSLANNYTVSGTNIDSIKTQGVYNIIDFSWNGAELPAVSGTGNIRINTTSYLLYQLNSLTNNINNLNIS